MSNDTAFIHMTGAFLLCWVLAFAPHAARIPRTAGEWAAYILRASAYLGIMLFVIQGADGN